MKNGFSPAKITLTKTIVVFSKRFIAAGCGLNDPLC